MQEIKSELLIEELPKSSKKIVAKILIITLAIVGLLFVSLGFIPFSYTMNINQSNVQYITLYQNGSASSELWADTNQEKFNSILEKFNATYSKDNIATALFSGKLFEKEIISYNFKSNVISSIAKNKNSESKYILFSYSQQQQIMLNGKEYNSNELSYSSKNYVKALVEVQNTSILTRANVYYINSSGNSYFNVTVNASGAQLYEYIETFFA